MTNTIQELFNRKSVRVFEKKAIPEEDVRLILESACQAPSAGNQQFYSIIRITDQVIKEKLAGSCDHQLFIKDAPLVLLFVADPQKWYDFFLEAGAAPRVPGPGEILISIEDTMISAQNAVVAAESLGIGSCYIGDILENVEYHRELLSLPEYTVPIGMLVFGYPTEQQKKREKPSRYRLSDIVMENKYVRKTGEEYRKMFAEKFPGEDYDRWMKKFCDFKWNSDFSVEMSRSSDVYFKTFQGNSPERK